MNELQKLYMESAKEDASKIGLPLSCLGSCSLMDEDFDDWKEQISFSKFYNLDLLRARVIKFFKNLDGKKIYEIDHSNDPVFDSSGAIIETNGEICWLYNGNSYPSFNSGCGLYHNTYQDDLTDIICDFILNPFNIADKERFHKEYFFIDIQMMMLNVSLLILLLIHQ